MKPSSLVVDSTTATVGVALYLVLFTNTALWRALFLQPVPAPWLLVAVVGLAITAVFNGILMLVASPRSFKPIACTLVLLASVTSYFLTSLGVVIDSEIVRNVFETDVHEAVELVTPALVLHLLLLGVLPCLALSRVQVHFRPFRAELRRRLLLAAVSLLLVGVGLAASYKDLALTIRQNPRLRMLVNPSSPIFALGKFVRQELRSPRVVATVGADAHRLDAEPGGRRPRVFVLVVGETARARQLSLNGYARETTPELQRLDIVNFPDVTSSGTSTAESLPCMFSDLTASHCAPDPARWRENLLDIVQRAGVGVLWRDNNSGCKHVCDRIPTERLRGAADPRFCDREECRDEILLEGLQEIVDAARGDLLVVLHQTGSHGPAYYKRVPPRFVRFVPTCAQDDVQNCDTESIVNAYDNTILYTDFVLSRLIDLLRRNDDRRDTALLYVSDHGESLGEHGIYLHGFPMMIAPADQTHVPMVFWGSPGFWADEGIDQDCLRAAAARQHYSHAHLFHSVLGALQISTGVYRPDLDLFAPCRRPTPPRSATAQAGAAHRSYSAPGSSTAPPRPARS